MSKQPEKLQFQPNGYFYDMVNTYNSAICGLLLYRKEFRATLDLLNTKYSGKLVGLGSREYPALEIKPHEVISLMEKGLIKLGEVTDNLSYMLLNIAYESVKHLLKTQDPIHEFFRHLRNGASHGGKLSFGQYKNKKGITIQEPSRPAEWRGRKVTRNLQGKKLWDLNLGPGDILVLLWDIEQGLIKSEISQN